MSSLFVYDCIVLPGDPRTVLHGPRLYSHSRSDALVRGLVPSVWSGAVPFGAVYSVILSFIHMIVLRPVMQAIDFGSAVSQISARVRLVLTPLPRTGLGKYARGENEGPCLLRAEFRAAHRGRLDWLRTAIARRTHVLTFLS